MKKKLIGGIRWCAVVGILASCMGCARANSDKENLSTVKFIKISEESFTSEDFLFDTMAEAVMNVTNITASDYMQFFVTNDLSEKIDVDWFFWNDKAEVGSSSCSPMTLPGNVQLSIPVDVDSENISYLIHVNYEGMNKYIAFHITGK